MKSSLTSLACATVALACAPLPALAGASRLPIPPANFAAGVIAAQPKIAATSRIVLSLRPNYCSRLDHRLAWPSLPVRVYFVPDRNFTRDLQDVARTGFDHWTDATMGFVRYSVTTNPRQADIFVRFDPDLNGGLTRTHFRKGRLFRADMTVGIAEDVDGDIECTAAHEFGHALGIDGHSDERSDLMFPVHVMGRGFGITQRDVNTLAMAYPALAKRIAAQAEARADHGMEPGY